MRDRLARSLQPGHISLPSFLYFWVPTWCHDAADFSRLFLLLHRPSINTPLFFPAAFLLLPRPKASQLQLSLSDHCRFVTYISDRVL